MATTSSILAFAGSTRKDSFNKKLLKIAVDGAKKAGAEVTVIDLKDFPMPLYDQDLHQAEGFPENTMKLKKLLSEHHGLLIASPEYNSSISGVLKNTIDWVSRPLPNEQDLAVFRGKVAAIMSASPGGLGGLRGLVHLRSMLENIFVMVLPNQVTVPQAGNAFGPDGNLSDPKKQEAALGLGDKLATLVRKIQD